MVGTARFELATPCPPCKCATRLRHVPTPTSIAQRAEAGQDGTIGDAERIDALLQNLEQLL